MIRLILSNKKEVLLAFFILITSGLIFSQNITELQNAIELAGSDSSGLIDAHFDLAKHHDKMANVDLATEEFKIALRIAKNINDDKNISAIANYLARIYWMNGDYNASIETYKLGLSSAEKTKDNSVIAKISMNLGNNYNYLGEYEQAIKYALHALEIKEGSNDLERICYHYVSMGNIFRENSKIEKWEEYVLKAYKMKNVEGCASLGDHAKIYNSLGGIAVQREEYEKALLYYDTLLILSRDANYDQGISTALSNSAGVYKQLNKPRKALELANKSEKYFGSNPYDLIFRNNFKAELYQILGENEKALDYVTENIKQEEIAFYSTELLKSLQLLYELNISLANYMEAFAWNDSLRIYENKLRDEEVLNGIQELETKYETEKKEQQIELLTAENKIKNQRNRISLLFVIALFVLLTLGVFVLILRRKQAILKQSDLQQKLLRSQMNPHFIFNVLGSIQNFMRKNEAKKAAQYLSQFASLCRSVLEFSSMESISLTEEVKMLKNYVELENMKSGNQFDFILKMNNQIESDFIRIPPMMLQVFVENAIKHGLSDIDYGGILILEILVKEDIVEFMLEDNGSGLKQSLIDHSGHKSMAMKIFNQRKKLIEKKYKRKLYFDLINLANKYSDQSGVRVSIHLPILNND